MSPAASIYLFKPPFAIGPVLSLPVDVVALPRAFTAESPPAQGQ